MMLEEIIDVVMEEFEGMFLEKNIPFGEDAILTLTNKDFVQYYVYISSECFNSSVTREDLKFEQVFGANFTEDSKDKCFTVNSFTVGEKALESL